MNSPQPSATTPDITAILLTHDSFDSLRTTVAHLAAQSMAARIELLVGAPAKLNVQIPPDAVQQLAAARVVPIADEPSVGAAHAIVVSESAAPIVVFCENHSYPDPNWAQALIDAFEEEGATKRAVVGPCVDNQNPGTATSWANLLLEYGDWMAHRKRVQPHHLPGHNSAYRRDVLLEYGDELANMLEAESILHWDLQSKGYSLLLEPKARTYHRNFSIWPATALLRFHGGRGFAAARSREWSLPKRLVYALASPLIPLVRWKRVVPIWNRCRVDYIRHHRRGEKPLPRLVLPVLVLCLLLDACGEFVGYFTGVGKSLDYLWDIEFARDRFARD